MPRVAVFKPSMYRVCSMVGAGGGTGGAGTGAGTGATGGGGTVSRVVVSCCKVTAVIAITNPASVTLTTPLTVEMLLRYYLGMAVPATSRIMRTFEDRADALAHFFQRAGEAPRLIAYDDAVGLPLDQALAALEWTAQVGILAAEDLVHAARLGPDSAAIVVERREGDNRLFVYFGPRMDAPPADPYEGTLLYDEPGVRSYIFAQRGHAIAHFLRATHGLGAALSLLSRRAPELRHIRRWTQALFAEPAVGRSTQLLAGWFATSGAGFLFVPADSDEPFAYCEVAIEG